jgi:amidase
METTAAQLPSSAIEIATDVRAGRRTPRDVVDACLARIAAEDHSIGAFQAVDHAGARRAADELTGRPDLAELPLAGVPVAVKDNIAVAGLPTRNGSAATSADPAPADDELVRRLRRAGAIVIGKTRMPELAAWGFTESIAYGGTRNPRDLSRNAGGSTGGGAAAVAAGMVPLALGSDGGGSLRIPAANCGVVGFKPARGVVPLAGGMTDHWYGCTQYGPIATTVGDATLAVDVLAGTDEWRQPGGDAAPLRVAVSVRTPNGIGRADADAREAVRTAAAYADAAGHEVSRANPPHPPTVITIWIRHWLAGVAAEVEQLGLRVADLEPRNRTVVTRGQRLRKRGRPTMAQADAWRARATEWLTEFDVLICPVMARPAPEAGWGTGVGYTKAYVNAALSVPFTQAWNLAGLPALSLPLSGTPERPGAVQLVSRPGNESALLRLAAQLERLTEEGAP